MIRSSFNLYLHVGARQQKVSVLQKLYLKLPKRVVRSNGFYRLAPDGPALIILALVCANVRNCVQPSSKLRALDTFLALVVHLTDEAKLDRMVPYIIDLLHDDAASVRVAALRTLIQVVSAVQCRLPVKLLTNASCSAAYARHGDYSVKRVNFSGVHLSEYSEPSSGP